MSSSGSPAEAALTFYERRIEVLWGLHVRQPVQSWWRVYGDKPDEFRFTINNQPSLEGARTEIGRGYILGRQAVRDVLNDPPVAVDTAVDPSPPEGGYIQLGGGSATSTAHILVPHAELSAFMTEADSQIPDTAA